MDEVIAWISTLNSVTLCKAQRYTVPKRPKVLNCMRLAPTKLLGTRKGAKALF